MNGESIKRGFSVLQAALLVALVVLCPLQAAGWMTIPYTDTEWVKEPYKAWEPVYYEKTESFIYKPNNVLTVPRVMTYTEPEIKDKTIETYYLDWEFSHFSSGISNIIWGLKPYEWTTYYPYWSYDWKSKVTKRCYDYVIVGKQNYKKYYYDYDYDPIEGEWERKLKYLPYSINKLARYQKTISYRVNKVKVEYKELKIIKHAVVMMGSGPPQPVPQYRLVKKPLSYDSNCVEYEEKFHTFIQYQQSNAWEEKSYSFTARRWEEVIKYRLVPKIVTKYIRI